MKPKIKKNKKAIISILLVVAILVTGAFALLSATDSKTNVFTVGNVKAKLSEEFDTNLDGEINRTDDATEREVYDKSEQGSDETIRMKKDIMPGQKVIKRPYVENTGKNKAWVYITVGIPTTDSDNVYRDKTTGETKIAGQDVSIPIRAYAIQESYANKTESDDIWNAYFDADKQLAAFGAEETAGVKLSERVPLFEILNEQRWSDITVGGTNDPNGEWSIIGSVYKSVNGYDYYVFGYNTILEAPDNADESIKTSFAFEGVKLSENIGEASPISLNYYEYEGDNDTLNGEVDLTVNSEVPEGYRLVKTEYYMPGATVPTLYYDESLAKTGYAFDWCFMDDLSKSAYSGMTITDDTNLIAAYTDKISPSEDSNEPTVNPTKIYPGSGYLCYAIEEDANGYFATLIGADSSSADYPSEPTTVTVPATLKVVTNSNGAKILENGIVKHGSLDDIAENATIPVKKVQLAEWQWDYNTNEVMDQTAVDLGKIAETLVLSDNIESLGFCGDIYQHNIASGFALKSINVPYACSEITSKAFYSCSNLTNVMLPNSLKEISSYAFAFCTSLPKFDTPDSVRTIGEYAFDGCSSLSEITIGSGVTQIKNCAFGFYGSAAAIKRVNIADISSYSNANVDIEDGGLVDMFVGQGPDIYINNSKITNLVIPEGVTKINKYIFAGYPGISSVTLSNTVKTIGKRAFCGSGIKNLNMGNGVVDIQECAFISCPISNITWSNNLVNIGSEAFADTQLEKINLPDKVEIVGNNAFNLSPIRNVKLNNSIKTIGSYAFQGNMGNYLESLTLPDSLETVGSGAFSTFEIQTLNIGSGLKSLGDDVFSRVYQNINVDDNNQNFTSKDGALYTKDFSKLLIYPVQNQIENLYLPEGLKTIPYHAFYGAYMLKSIHVPSTVIEIGNNIIEGTAIETISVNSGNSVYDSRDNCNAIIETATNKLITACAKTVIPNSVTVLGAGSYINCGVNILNIPSSIQTIEFNCFAGEKINISSIESWLKVDMQDNMTWTTLCLNGEPLTAVTIPEGVTKIPNNAFMNQSQITGVTFPDSLKEIGEQAFYDCSNITNLVIPKNVIHIGSLAFAGCSGVTNLTLPNGIKTIGSGAFARCTNILNVTIPNTVTEISPIDFVSGATLNIEDIAAWCSLSINTSEYAWQSSDVEIKITHSGSEINNLTIPTGVTSIGAGFNFCKTITSLTIPTSVKSISEYAFNYCSNLTSITYEGTTAQWEQMNVPPTSLPAGITITCTNGTLTTA